MFPRSTFQGLVVFALSVTHLSNALPAKSGLRARSSVITADYVTATPGPPPPTDYGLPPDPPLNSFLSYPHPPAPCTEATVRKEWRTLSTAQRALWISSVKCLAHKPHWPGLTALGGTPGTPALNTSGSAYDDHVFLHLDQANFVHLTGFFPPFHRLYMYSFDLALRQHCGYTGPTPYWNWSQDADSFYDATIWDDNLEYGLGHWGNPNNNYEVDTGGVSYDFPLSYPFPHRMRREFTLEPFNLDFFPVEFQQEHANSTFTPANMNAMVQANIGDYPFWQHDFEVLWGAHGSVHGILGGELGGVCPGTSAEEVALCANFQFSPNEIMFWLHHNNVDRFWWAWQNAHPEENFWAFAGGSIQSSWPFNITTTQPNGAGPALSVTDVIPNDNLIAVARVADVLDTMGGFLCYTYDTPVF